MLLNPAALPHKMHTSKGRFQNIVNYTVMENVKHYMDIK